MIENLIVAVIVSGSAWYAGAKYLPAAWRARMGRNGSGCSSGCDTCKACAEPPPSQSAQRVIKLRVE